MDRFTETVLASDTIDESMKARITRTRDGEYVPWRDTLNLSLADADEHREIPWEDRMLRILPESYENEIRRLHDERRRLQEETIQRIVPRLPESVLDEIAVPENVQDHPGGLRN